MEAKSRVGSENEIENLFFIGFVLLKKKNFSRNKLCNMQHLVHHDLYFKEVYRIYITYEKK